MAIAFFDLDKTLLAENSAKLWLREEWRNNHIAPAHMLRASYWLLKYHLGFTKFDNVIEKSLGLIEGENEAEVLDKTDQFFHSTIKSLYRPGALDAIEKHRQAGHKISLLTSSFDGLSKLVQSDLALDFCLCSSLEVDERGLYTGRTKGPPCFGENKITYAEELCQKEQVSLMDCAFYTDSASDIPLLNRVGNPTAVNPDPHLRARARLKKWDIVDWGRPNGYEKHGLNRFLPKKYL